MRPHSVIGIDRHIDVQMIGSITTSPGKLTRGQHLNSYDTLHLALARLTIETRMTLRSHKTIQENYPRQKIPFNLLCRTFLIPRRFIASIYLFDKFSKQHSLNSSCALRQNCIWKKQRCLMHGNQTTDKRFAAESESNKRNKRVRTTRIGSVRIESLTDLARELAGK